MSQNGKQRRFTFNVVDALIILALVALIGIMIYTLVLGKSLEDLYSDEVEITYTVSIKQVDESVLKIISVGDKVYHSDKNKNSGTVTGISHTKNKEAIDLEITVSAIARVNKDGVYSINKEIIEKNGTINLKFARFEPKNPVCQGLK